MVTIKDVAHKAGVNPSTVSRVLKDHQSISIKTKEKVRKAMRELGYVPNVAAQILASGLTYSIGLVFPPLLTPDRLSEPFFMQILSTITNEAKNNDFTVSIATGMTMGDLEKQVQLMYKQKRVDGFIILYSEQDDPIKRYLLANRIPFVIVGAPEGFENQITYIDNDNQLMARTAVEFLYDKGHGKVLFVTDDLQSEVSSERYIGYLKGIMKLGLPSQPPLLFDRKDPATVEHLIDTIRNFQATALIVIGDVLAIRIVQLLSYYELKVPDDLSVITFNNSAYGKLIHPYLTTFDINISSLGSISFKRLLAIIKNPNVELSEKIIVPFTLKERESVRNLRKTI
ncbi:LacI family DNA-binding transcriptional regulator [Streptococcus pantholopis]|uniref:LacI family transcriptional regulator n=1 Tax=Streptococcus pantholopis TaxID=1811193 RepID=A0A172Q6Q0_9STRE|nr:LacI family DNA-binding transcriptional regulator [Streptococcus pantholopis]AND79136.1 LacI family transcriptional regulator [Streptococcus pantholopis]